MTYIGGETPEVGDIVRADNAGRQYPTYCQWHGLSGVDHSYVVSRDVAPGQRIREGDDCEVVVVDRHQPPTVTDRWGTIALIRCAGRNDALWGVVGLRLVARAKGPSIALDKVKHTRAGWPVANVVASDDPERPIQADVFVGRTWMVLTFQASGKFYGRAEQGIDLVQA